MSAFVITNCADVLTNQCVENNLDSDMNDPKSWSDKILIKILKSLIYNCSLLVNKYDLIQPNTLSVDYDRTNWRLYRSGDYVYPEVSDQFTNTNLFYKCWKILQHIPSIRSTNVSERACWKSVTSLYELKSKEDPVLMLYYLTDDDSIQLSIYLFLLDG